MQLITPWVIGALGAAAATAFTVHPPREAAVNDRALSPGEGAGENDGPGLGVRREPQSGVNGPGAGVWVPKYYDKLQHLGLDALGEADAADVALARAADDEEVMPIEYYLSDEEGRNIAHWSDTLAQRVARAKTSVPPLSLDVVGDDTRDILQAAAAVKFKLGDRPDGLPSVSLVHVTAVGYEVHLRLKSEERAQWGGPPRRRRRPAQKTQWEASIPGEKAFQDLRALFGARQFDAFHPKVVDRLKTRLVELLRRPVYTDDQVDVILSLGVQFPVEIRVAWAFPWFERLGDLTNYERVLPRAIRVVYFSCAAVLPTSGMREAIRRDLLASAQSGGAEGFLINPGTDLTNKVYLVDGDEHPWTPFAPVFIHAPHLNLLTGPSQGRGDSSLARRAYAALSKAVKEPSLEVATVLLRKVGREGANSSQLRFACPVFQLFKWDDTNNFSAHNFCVRLPMATSALLPHERVRILRGTYPVGTDAIFLIVQPGSPPRRRWVHRKCEARGWTLVDRSDESSFNKCKRFNAGTEFAEEYYTSPPIV